MELGDRFWDKVDRTGDCWEWRSNIAAGGYPQFSYQGEPRYAHRLVMESEGHDVDDVQVNHHCDNPQCVNPEHLYIGDQSDNVQDSHDRNRREDVEYASGEDHGQSKLTAEQVEEIRDSDETQVELAERFGVSQSLISQIQNGKWWT
jgi:hypothetical protein